MKEIMRAIAELMCLVLLAIPIFILYYIRIVSYVTVSLLLSLIPRPLGFMPRKIWYKCTLAKCGENRTVDFLGVISTAKTKVGNNVYVGINNFIDEADIGDDTMIAANVHVLSGTEHGIKRLNIPMRLQKGTHKRIKIGKDCWIGSKSIIMADVADHTVVGAGSVVTKTFKPYDIIAGVPAQKIKSRKD